MSDSTETRWFKILVLIASGLVAGVSLANIIYYNRIRTGSCTAVSVNEATGLLVVNVIIFIIAILLFLWALWRLLFSREFRVKAQGATLGYLGSQGQFVPTTTIKTPQGPVTITQQVPQAVQVITPETQIATSGSGAFNVMSSNEQNVVRNIVAQG